MSFIPLFISLSLSSHLFFDPSSDNSSNCAVSPGCSLQYINQTVQVGDSISITQPLIKGEASLSFLRFLNSSSSKKLAIKGYPTSISDPGLAPSEYSAIYVENGSISLSDLSFSGFTFPILNGVNSSFNLARTSFLSSEATRSPILGFILCNISANDLLISNNTANSQSILITLNSSVTISNFTFSTNFLESRDVRAALHFIGSSVTVTFASFLSNVMKLPLIASSNFSSFSVADSFLKFNKIFSAFALEFNSSIAILNTTFSDNDGGLVAGGHNSSVTFSESRVTSQHCEELLFALIDANLTFSHSSFSNSSIAGVAFSQFNLTNGTLNAYGVNFTNIQSKMSLLSSIGGNVEIASVDASEVASEAEIIFLSHQNGGITKVSKSSFSKMSSKSSVSTSIASMNGTSASVSNVQFLTNSACGLLFENISVAVSHSNFSMNQCFPVGNAIPLAILTSSLTQNATLTDCTFRNNTAITGSVFLMNASAHVSKSIFYGNQAVQGAALFAAGMNVSVSDSKFEDNSAMAFGGAVSLSEGNAEFDDCEFSGNNSPEGSALSIKQAYNITLRRVTARKNVGTNGTFINAEGKSLHLLLDDCKVDDEFSKAVFVDRPHLTKFGNSKFNCHLRCEEVGKLTPRAKEEVKPNIKTEKKAEAKEEEGEEVEEEKAPTYAIWALIPITVAVAALVYRKIGSRGIAMVFKRLLRSKKKFEQ